MPQLTLTTPVTVDGITRHDLTLRRPKARDLLNVARESDDPETREVILFAWLAGVSRATIEELDLYDYRALQRVYESFTAAPPAVEDGADR